MAGDSRDEDRAQATRRSVYRGGPGAAVRKAEAEKDGYRAWVEWTAIAADFGSPLPAGLENRKDVKDGIKRARSEESLELRERGELVMLIEGAQSEDSEARQVRLARLRQVLSKLSREAKGTVDSPARRMARRQLANASAAVRSFRDPEVQKLFEPFRSPNPFQ